MQPPPEADGLRSALFGQLPDEARGAVDALIEAARPAAVYAVGGAVRDLILGRDVVDLDLAVESDAIAVVKRALPDVRMTAHRRFGTASFRAGGRRIDVVTARSETYARPGALPRVTPAGIDEDLRRRDFSVNAIALRLSGDATIIDPCGGVADIDARLIRVLHDASFRDDATRIFRACRYAARLGSSIEPATYALAVDAARYIDTLSAARVRRELELIAGETAADKAMRLCADLGALAAVHPALAWPAGAHAGLERSDTHRADRSATAFALLAARAPAGEAEAITARLRLRRDEAAAVHGVVALRDAASLLERGNAKPSGVVMLLDRYPLASVIAFASVAESAIAASLALRYLDDWRHVAPELRGDDVIALGVPQGPQVQKALQLVRAARLDGTARDLADERVLVLRFARSIKEAGAMTGTIELHTNGH
jgi:tRNA nucleotidyltransferase (CCA-adding enzyme)